MFNFKNQHEYLLYVQDFECVVKAISQEKELKEKPAESKMHKLK